MAVKMRLKRMGSKQMPFYRIVITDSRNPRDGKANDEIGYYNPVKEKAMKWLRQGAQPTDTVKNLLTKVGINEKFHNEKMASKKKSAK